MKNNRSFLCALFALLSSLVHASEKRPPLSADQKSFLTQYEAVRAGLAADDLAAAKKAAASTAAPSAQGVEATRKIAAADSLAAAREAFKSLSREAMALAAGQPGYFHAHCPMVPRNEGGWVQPARKISNPYFGKSMATCGSIEN
ncbi:MAG TPA: hypothetical protein VM029_16380 [Opitutaceae bacterium]|nr:hypothetical protein [Opitutaceae bacterium]